MRSICVLLVLVLSIPSLAAQGGPLYRVQRVVDGDTIIVDGIGRIRLIGVDTPESVDPRRPVQRYAREAGEFLKSLLDGQSVRLDYDVERFDRYKRTLAYVYLPDGTFVNEQIIARGYGFAYTRFPFKHLQRFRTLEQDARSKGLGLWAR